MNRGILSLNNYYLFGKKCFSRLVHNRNKNRLPVKTIIVGSIASILYGYDSIFNELQSFNSVERFSRSAKIALFILCDYAWSLKGITEDNKEYTSILQKTNKRAAERILEGCLKNGGLYIKIGQGVAAINHILPIEYIETLKLLQDKCLPRKPEEVKQIFLQEFGKTPDEMFNNFNYKPIAAASLAQVFECETKEGKKLAIKVQYIDLQKRFSSDIGTILFLQNVIGLFFKNYKFGWIIEDLKQNLLQELNFIHEGLNSERCANDLKQFKYVYLPKVYWEYTTTRILTAEFIDGYKIDDIAGIKRENLDLSDIDLKLFNIFAHQIFSTGFVHADPHPGNIFVRKNHKTGKSEIILLDHGLYECIPYEIRQNLCQFWKSIVLKDYKSMKFYASQLNVNDYKKFAEILLQRPLEVNISRNQFVTKLTDEDLKYMTDMAKKEFDLVMNTLREMPRNMLFVIRNLNTVRSIARDHNDPLDRPKIMARYALKCTESKAGNFFGFLIYLRERFIFEYKLWISSTRFWILTSYLNFLTRIGRAPDTKSLFGVDVKL